MNIEKIFTDKTTIKLWDQYFRRVIRHSRSLKPDQQEDLRLEIQDHLYESFKGETGENEVEKLLNAIEKIGDPEEYIKPMIAERLFESASRTFNPKTVLKGLYYNLTGSLKNLMISISYTFGYIFAVTFGVIAILKVFMPDNVGFFFNQNGFPILGITDNSDPGRTDVLGYWIIPIGLVISVLLYLVLTRKLRTIKKKKIKK